MESLNRTDVGEIILAELIEPGPLFVLVGHESEPALVADRHLDPGRQKSPVPMDRPAHVLEGAVGNVFGPEPIDVTVRKENEMPQPDATFRRWVDNFNNGPVVGYRRVRDNVRVLTDVGILQTSSGEKHTVFTGSSLLGGQRSQVGHDPIMGDVPPIAVLAIGVHVHPEVIGLFVEVARRVLSRFDQVIFHPLFLEWSRRDPNLPLPFHRSPLGSGEVGFLRGLVEAGEVPLRAFPGRGVLAVGPNRDRGSCDETVLLDVPFLPHLRLFDPLRPDKVLELGHEGLLDRLRTLTGQQNLEALLAAPHGLQIRSTPERVWENS